MKRTINDHASANCCVYYDNNNNSILRSYNTLICGKIDNYIFCTGLYSRTTIKHIGWYAREIGLNYFTFKAIANKDYFVDIETGEIIDPANKKYKELKSKILNLWYF